MIGNSLDQYLITARLGSGSLGETYLAESMVNGRKVVLKLINQELAAKPWLLEKIGVLSQHNAPGVLPFTLEASEERPYLLIPDYFPDNLQSYLAKLHMQKKQVKTADAIALIIHLISRLRQINFTQLTVHGGLHPRNMLVQFTVEALPNGEKAPKAIILADFHQADWVREATAAAEQPFRGLAPFTPPWLWVETESGKGEVLEADGRSDLFALGHLLYFLLKNEYLHVAKKPAENEVLGKQYEAVSKRIIHNEKMGKSELADYAELAALTAVRLHPTAPEKMSDTQLWQRWHHALLTMHRGAFALAELRIKANEIHKARAVWVDDIWHISDPLPFLAPDAPEAQLNLPSLNSDETVNESPLAVERPSPDKTYIAISRPGASNGNRQPETFYTLRSDQGFVTVGSHSGKDICLTRDGKIGPHHLDIRLVGDKWELYANGGDILLNGTAVSPGQPEIWSPDTAVTIGSYCLHLHQPIAESVDQRITVKLLPPQLALKQGFQGKVGITIRNNGAERSYFLVSVTDLGALDQPPANSEVDNAEKQATAWFNLPKTGVVLNPGEQQDLFLQVHPPTHEMSQMRPYQIEVSRLDDELQKKAAKGHIFLQAVTDFDTRLTAVSSQNDGAYRLIIRNKSNKSQTYQVHSVDPLKALKFAEVSTTTENSQQKEDEPSAPPPSRANGHSRTNILNNPLFNRAVRQAGGGQLLTEVSAVRQQTRRLQTNLRGASTLIPKTQLTFPKVPKRLPFIETFLLEETILPGKQIVIFFKAKARKRPFRYQPQRDIPFSLTITPQLGTEGETREETAVLTATTRLSRPLWALLVGLLLFSCLLLTALSTFQVSNAAGGFLATQESASSFSRTDVETDGLSSRSEAAIHFTNPQLRDTDGDGLSDGFEVSLGDPRICPTSIDCDGNGILDPVEIGFATPTPTPVASVPFVLAEPTPSATPIPTVTPTSTAVAQSQPTRTASITFSRSDLDLTLGDNSNNEPQTFALTFNTASQLPANAIIHEATFFMVMRNPEQYGRLQQELGNVYVTEGASASQQQLGALAEGSVQSMDLAYNTHNILLTTLPFLSPDGDGVVTIRLFFELGSDLDGQADLLQIWSRHDEQSSLEHPPTLQITYSLPGSP